MVKIRIIIRYLFRGLLLWAYVGDACIRGNLACRTGVIFCVFQASERQNITPVPQAGGNFAFLKRLDFSIGLREQLACVVSFLVGFCASRCLNARKLGRERKNRGRGGEGEAFLSPSPSSVF